MNFLKIGFILSAFALFAVACGEASKTTNSTTNTNTTTKIANTNTTTPTTDELAATKKIYDEKCVRCHKDDGTGGVTEIDGVKIKAPDLTSEKKKNDSDKEFIEAIEKGFPDDGMPAFKGKISDDEIKNLVKLIRRDFQKK